MLRVLDVENEDVVLMDRLAEIAAEHLPEFRSVVQSQRRTVHADEPTGNVDDTMALRLMHLFEELNKLGTTIVIATHNEKLVNRLGHVCLRLERGWLEVAGRLGDVSPGTAA